MVHARKRNDLLNYIFAKRRRRRPTHLENRIDLDFFGFFFFLVCPDVAQSRVDSTALTRGSPSVCKACAKNRR